jgi:16S rRNA G1207 methylase RsmC
MKGLREYFKDSNMSLENITTITIAGAGLLRWVIAMMNHYGILKIVAPKRNAVAAAEKMLNTAQNELERIQAEVYTHGICHKQKKSKNAKTIKKEWKQMKQGKGNTIKKIFKKNYKNEETK